MEYNIVIIIKFEFISICSQKIFLAIKKKTFWIKLPNQGAKLVDPYSDTLNAVL